MEKVALHGSGQLIQTDLRGQPQKWSACKIGRPCLFGVRRNGARLGQILEHAQASVKVHAEHRLHRLDEEEEEKRQGAGHGPGHGAPGLDCIEFKTDVSLGLEGLEKSQVDVDAPIRLLVSDAHFTFTGPWTTPMVRLSVGSYVHRGLGVDVEPRPPRCPLMEVRYQAEDLGNRRCDEYVSAYF